MWYRVRGKVAREAEGTAIMRDVEAVLRTLIKPESEGRTIDPIAASLAWCFLREANLLRPDDREWPTLGTALYQETYARHVYSGAFGSTIQELAKSRSTQIAIRDLLRTVLVAPETRSIQGVHYLYFLSVAMKHGAWTGETNEELALAFADGSPYGKKFEQFKRVPEVYVLFENCRSIYGQRDLGTR
jgi:hypothetical protein